MDNSGDNRVAIAIELSEAEESAEKMNIDVQEDRGREAKAKKEVIDRAQNREGDQEVTKVIDDSQLRPGQGRGLEDDLNLAEGMS